MIWTPIGYITEKTDFDVEIQDGIYIDEALRIKFNEAYPCPKEHPKVKNLLDVQVELVDEIDGYVNEIRNIKKKNLALKRELDEFKNNKIVRLLKKWLGKK